MPTILQLRRGTTAENASYTGSVGELTVDTTLNKVIVHDGSTAGGATVGNLQGNIQLGKTAAGEIDTSSGNLTIDSAGGTTTLDDNVVISGSLTVSGTTTTVDSTTISIQNSFVFEGATDDAHETTLTTVDPTADRTISLPNATGTVVLKDTTDELQNKTLTSAVLNTAVSGSAILDEDNMATNSATQLATQQSIKAYVDSQVTAQDLDLTTDSGTIAIDLDSETLTLAGGTGIGSTGSSNTVTFAIDSTVVQKDETQTLTNKTLTTPTLTSPVLNTAVSGSAFLDEDDLNSNSATKLASQQSIKAYVDAQITAQDLDFSADSGGALSIDLNSESMTFTGGSGITTTGSGNTVTFAINSDVVTLTGTQTLLNKTLTSPTLNSPTIVSATATTLTLSDSSIIFEGATADDHETTLTVTDPTADRTLTLPNSSGTVLTTANAATDGFALAMAAALG